ncbi:ExbD/TolR family protein [Ruixingdingia sedimenti]|uniref:Biopolymer transporter ExbD n=1 Tax=Ruixingdingia sedimenti TaxID=3073604 RepID=A0ABU1F2I2_9RHOB|nr:biopolymer transporter ExbD [Xinfangfangia sp. LG-4]MDR5651057.1 biopolymer transporter ExbD [Xinfangfangia sp. LG-4]
MRRRFSDPPRERNDVADYLLPLIDVVFFLLVFFMVATRLMAPPPFKVDPAVSEAQDELFGDFTLYVDAQGQFGYRDAMGPEALAVLAGARVEYCMDADCEGDPPRLAVKADHALPATQLAALLPGLGQAGFRRVELVALPISAQGGTP